MTTKRPGPSFNTIVLYLCCPVALCAVGVLVWQRVDDYFEGKERERIRALFAPHVSTYLAVHSGSLPPAPGPGSNRAGRKVTVGRVVPVDENKRVIDDLLFHLPARLRPASPREVEVVAWLAWSRRRVGTYDDGQPAIVHDCRVALFDLKKKTLIAQRMFAGPTPADFRKRYESSEGDRPYHDIAVWLNDVRVRPRDEN